MRCSKCIPKCTYAPNFITSRSTYNWKYNLEKINYILRMRRTQFTAGTKKSLAILLHVQNIFRTKGIFI